MKHPHKVAALLSTFFSAALLAYALKLLGQIIQGGPQVFQLGHWPAPYGISFVADLLSALFICATSLVFFAFNVFSLAYTAEELKNKNLYFLCTSLVFASLLCFLAGDLLTLFLSLELLSMTSLSLITLGSTRDQTRQAIPYVILNAISAFSFFVGLGILYGHTGNLNMAYLANLLRQTEWTYGIRCASIFIFFSLCAKAAMFPLFFWLPRAYSSATSTLSALLSAFVTTTALYALLRIFTLIFPIARDLDLQILLYICALLTMFIGAIGALAQERFKDALSLNVIVQSGFFLWGFALFSPTAIAASIFFTLQNIFVRPALYFVDAISENNEAIHTKRYSLILLLGFTGVFFFVQEALRIRDFIGIFVAAVSSLLCLISLIRNSESATSAQSPRITGISSIAFLSILALLISVFSKSLYDICIQASEALIDPSIYVLAVLGKESAP